MSAAKKYTEDHEAVVYDDQTQIGTVSITDYAQSSLGDVVYVELPQQGTEVDQGGEFGCSCAVILTVTNERLVRPNWRGGEREGRFGYCECMLL